MSPKPEKITGLHLQQDQIPVRRDPEAKKIAKRRFALQASAAIVAAPIKARKMLK